MTPSKTLGLVLSLVLSAASLAAGQYQSFRVAVYIRAYEVQKMKDPEWLRTNWAIVEKQLKVDKVYLEVHRDLIIIDPATLAAAKAFFVSKGIAVSGGIATVKNERKLFETFDYTNPEDRAKITEIVTATAKAFEGGWFRSGDLAVLHEDARVKVRWGGGFCADGGRTLPDDSRPRPPRDGRFIDGRFAHDFDWAETHGRVFGTGDF